MDRNESDPEENNDLANIADRISLNETEEEALAILDREDGSETSNSFVEEIPLTAAEVIDRMEEAWINEKFSPEIQPNRIELVDCLLGQISHMEENLENLSDQDFKKDLHQLELDRLRFVVTSYLRTRLEKIELFVFHILQQEEQRAEADLPLYLTENELVFAQSYKDSIENHFNDVLKFWPGLPPDNWKDEPVTPNMHSFVFLKSKVNVEGVVIDEANEGEDNDLVDLQSNSQMIISYNSIHNLLKSDSIKLV